jgi:hypothetical protein
MGCAHTILENWEYLVDHFVFGTAFAIEFGLTIIGYKRAALYLSVTTSNQLRRCGKRDELSHTQLLYDFSVCDKSTTAS